MKWLWRNVLWPVMRGLGKAAIRLFTWAWDNPVAGTVVGLGALFVSSFFPEGTVKSWTASFGYALATTAITAGIWDWAKPSIDVWAGLTGTPKALLEGKQKEWTWSTLLDAMFTDW